MAPKGKKRKAKPARRPRPKKPGGIDLGFGIRGKYLFRVRERHLAEHIAPLLRGHATGAAKLDLLLRCIALPPERPGKREVGLVLPSHSWVQLHDLVRGSETIGDGQPELDATPAIRHQKRKWVGEQLQRLEEMDLVRRTLRPGERPLLTVLRDDGSGRPFDDPHGGPGNAYATMLGAIISSGALRAWGTAELAAYLACMIAEWHDLSFKETEGEAGTRQWFRPLSWFADEKRRFGPVDRPRIPFSVPTLERGMSKLAKEGLVARETIRINPHTGKNLRADRTLYTNRFDQLG
jgi:hypothetical protein